MDIGRGRFLSLPMSINNRFALTLNPQYITIKKNLIIYFFYYIMFPFHLRIEYNTTSSVIIKELSTSRNGKINGFKDKLALPPIPTDTSSMTDLHIIHKDPNLSAETKSLSNTSQTSEKKKKTIGARIINTFKGKKHKKLAMAD